MLLLALIFQVAIIEIFVDVDNSNSSSSSYIITAWMLRAIMMAIFEMT